MKAISKYNVEVWGEARADGARAVIHLMGDGGPRVALGRVYFHDAKAALPRESVVDGLLTLHMPMAAFSGLVALLQHDSPMMVGMSEGRGVLRTGEWERVGETELGLD